MHNNDNNKDNNSSITKRVTRAARAVRHTLGLILLLAGVAAQAATAPGAPTGAAATAGNAQATVTFVAPASNGGSAITGYTVTSLPAGGVDSNAGTTGLSHVVTGLVNGTAYTFTVKATNAIGTSVASTASASVTPATVPNAPTGAAATAGNAQATVTFTAPASNGGSAITGYTVTSSPTGGVDSNAGTTGLSHVVTGLVNGTAYTFTVKATNAKGASVASTASASVTPATVPGAPTIGTATAGNAQATVTFTAPASNGGSAITGYTVTSLPAGGVDSNAGTTGLSHVITGIVNGTAYTFTVKATNAKGTSVASTASNSVTPAATVPGAPTGAAATAGNAQATVTFVAPVSNGGSAITGYTVTSLPAGGMDSNAGTTGLSHVVTGLVNGTAYTFTVKATNAKGASVASTASNSVTPAATVPGAPTGAAATAGNAQATLTFVAPTSNGGSAITGYTVTSLPAGGVDSNAGTTGLSHIVTGLTNGTAYTFTVKATNAKGTSVASTASNSVTPTAPATVPGAPTGATAVGGNAQATVTFTAPASNGGSAITGYTVTSLPAGGVDSNAGTTGLSHIVTGLVNGTAYTFTVKATNAIGSSVASTASASVTPATVPGAPTIGTATAGNAQATVTFAAPASNGGSVITGYTVTSLPAGGVDSNAGTTGLSHVITGLTNGTAYTFTVKATNAKGASVASTASNSVTPTVPATAPGAPTGATAVGGNAQATVSFTAPASNGGSAITGYTVTSLPAGGVDSNTGTTGLSHVITGLTNGTAYTFTVKATNAIGTSIASTASNSVTPILPNLPPTVSITTPANNAVIGSSDKVITKVTSGYGPYFTAINQLTNKIYEADSSGNTVTVVDGATNAVSRIVVGLMPYGIALNQNTNKIYAADFYGSAVSVIDGATNAVTTIAMATGSCPGIVKSNPVSNKIYVTDQCNNKVVVIDGATNAVTLVAVGNNPTDIVVDTLTNKIYTADMSGNTVTVIDGATNVTSTITLTTSPYYIALNETTNKIYVANWFSNTVTVIDGISNLPTTVALPTGATNPGGIEVNPVTNKIYVTDAGNGNVNVIDGVSNGLNTIALAAGSVPYNLAINPVSNKVYVSDFTNGIVVIDGATNAITTSIPSGAGSYPSFIAVNPSTNTIYAMQGDNTYTTPTNNAITVINGSTPALLTLSANAADVDGSVTKVEFYNGAILKGTATTAPYSYNWLNLATGSYTVTAKAYDNQGAITTSAAIHITSDQAPAVSLSSPVAGAQIYSNASFNLSATATSSVSTISRVDFYANDGVNNNWLGAATTGVGGIYSYSWLNVPAGNYSLTAVATDALGTTTTSAATSVKAIANVAVSLTSPLNGTTMKVPGNFTLNATATATTGSIAKVDFYANDGTVNTLLKSVTVAPYSYTWSSVTLGRYSITAVVTDSLNATITSAPAIVTVDGGLSNVYYIYSDQLDTPRQITNTSGTVVWQWDNSDPFGNNVPNENPSGQGTFVNNLGFPGQYRDKETNTFYNGFRDCYDPATGRYCQSDPFGLAAGINTYVYALSNPLSYTDPDGRNPILLAGLGVAAAFYFGIDQFSSLLQAKWKFEELQQLNKLKNAQIGCANSGGQSCGDPQKTEAAINQCSRESIPAASDAGYSQLPSPAEKGIDLLKKAIK